ncbi:MAG: lipopolysaccharide biosynthesis protein [Janthinobacterium lividum]
MSIIKYLLASFKNIHFQSLLGNGVMAIIGMVTIAILYRSLTVNDIGVYIFFMTILGLVETLKSGFLTTAFIKFYAGTNQERANEVAGSAWCLALAISGILILINVPTFFFSFYISNHGMVLFLKYFSIISLSGLPSFMANLVVQGEKRFDRLLWLRLVNQVLFTGTIVALIVLKKASLNAIILTYGVSNLIAGIAAMLLGWTKLESIKYRSSKAFWEIFHFGKYSMGTSISSNLFAVTDTFFINFFLGPAALAVFNLGGKLLQIVETPLVSFAASGMPGLAGFYNKGQKEDMIYLMNKMIGMLTIAIVLIALVSVIFAEPIIRLIGGEKYVHTEAPNMFRIFMSTAILYPIDRFFALTLDVIHKPKINFYKILIMLAVNLIADYVGFKIYHSVYVIAIANLVPIIVAIAISYFPLNSYFKFGFWNIYKIGYKEIILFIKQLYCTLFTKKQTAVNI